MSLKVLIATPAELENIYNKKIDADPANESLRAQKERRLIDARHGTKIFFFAYLDGELVSEANATVSVRDVHTQNINYVVDGKTAYLSAFFTKEKHRGKGYFSILYAFIENELKSRGFKRLTLGVEPWDEKNKMIYKKWGYTELIHKGTEEFDGMKIDVEYYRKSLI